ncbi:DNA-formamidopyrimidine glycosylase family protein [Thiohalomonas denitrificans]|uniref:Formamidopyrimidine-DNA glycosylase n=1 Tax=Thiohalomonas denitrificans TaxID=415747 RepID=A0A1G5QHL4_9GAMM|nr:DNA-formamidopyrimidine glycosylase family protein [Thiohalomonas denitrificans]SCZ61217.1 formamidopyrimidine-DNA glycosylase [Thiohalomonas denitrificans]
MPELPDVEVYKHHLEAHGMRKVIDHIELRGADRMLGDTDTRSLRKRLEGHSLTGTFRHGKYLFAHIGGNGWLVLHFGMTGYFEYGDDGEADPQHNVLVLYFKDGSYLAFNCRRKLGAIALAETPEEFIANKGLGPDVTALSESDFSTLLQERGGTAKGLLMNQELLAGLGNVYSDEVLFQAGIHPKTRLDRLEGSRRKALYQAMQKVIKAAIAAEAEPERMPDDFLIPRRGLRNAKCPFCGGTPKRISASGRHAWYCPCRQPEPE